MVITSEERRALLGMSPNDQRRFQDSLAHGQDRVGGQRRTGCQRLPDPNNPARFVVKPQ